MKLSFVIPSYNQGQYIKTCLDSIYRANAEKEVWVIDGGSKDETITIVEKHPVVTGWISEPDRGQAHALNKGFSQCTGDLLFWINSDDYYLDGAIDIVASHFEANPDEKIVYGIGHHVDEANKQLKNYTTEPWNYSRLNDICFLCQPAVVFHRSIYEEFGGPDERFHLGLDLEYWLRIGKKYPFTQVQFPIAASRLWSETKSSLKQFEMQEEALRLSYIYGGKWSKRRFWGLVENWIFLENRHIVKNSCMYFGLKISYACKLKRKLYAIPKDADLREHKILHRTNAH